MSQNIICPNCNTKIDLDKIADHKYRELLKQQENDLKSEQEKQKLQFEKELEEKTNEMRKKAWEFAEKKAEEERKKVELEMLYMQERLKKSEEEKQVSKKKELELINKQKDLEDKEKHFELEMEKKLYLERKKIEENLSERLKQNSKKEFDEKLEKAQEDFRKKIQEKDKQIEQTNRSLDDAKRKSEQGSQQIQGDIQENDLKNALNQAFPIDNIEDVPTWVKWADLIQNVKNNLGQNSGIIVWESKNTKAWTESWIMKLKEDKLKVNWNIAILVTTVLPKNMKNFWMIDDVMVCIPEFAIPISTMLRDKLLSVSKVEKSLEWKDVKMEMLYKYLWSDKFSLKINMMVDSFSTLRQWIEKERRFMEKMWKAREMDLLKSDSAISWIYWELESLMWQSLPWAEKLELWIGDEDS